MPQISAAPAASRTRRCLHPLDKGCGTPAPLSLAVPDRADARGARDASTPRGGRVGRKRARRPRRQDASADASIMQAPKPANRAPPRRAAIRTDGIPAARLHGARNIIQEESTAGTPCARGPFTWGRAQRCACRRRPRAREPFAWGCAPRGAREREAPRAHSLGACVRARRGREICARAQRGIVARARSRWRCAPTE